MITLMIDTTCDHLSIGIVKDKKIIDRLVEKTNKNQSEIFMTRVKTMLDDNGLTLQNVKEIYLTIGPGSFTGVRLGLAFAKTVAMLNDIRIRTVSTLFALAGIGEKEVYIDARSGQAFFAKYKDGKEVKSPRLVDYDKEFTSTEHILETMLEVYDIANVVEDIRTLSALYIKDSNATKLND